jgi:hypothetical protein
MSLFHCRLGRAASGAECNGSKRACNVIVREMLFFLVFSMVVIPLVSL